ncbi:uncharacterized protein LOC110419610 [Herrania umbratica]|uniref:Uncharacterized protein LOC110419610 n=1 Tax=Herrania umbratica TaxID=108875 RepID=A0A6J1AN45_9ROSI|nr:uncharacterized protein LOC110419610 [Herrania umbratica]
MEFEQLHMKCDVQEPEKQTVARYLGGLNVEIVDVVQLQPYWNFNDVIRLTLSSNYGRQNSATIPLSTVNSSKTASKNDKETAFIRAFNVNKKCFKCQGFGHIASDCPNRRIISLVKEEVMEEFIMEEFIMEEIEDELEIINGDKIEEVVADRGEVLVIHHNLKTVMMNEDESWLRHNILYTRCTSQRKACNVIIDSGSCENVVANYMVEKLKLPIETHPHPCKLQWLRKRNVVKVTRHCCVQFSIENKYQVEAWSDVIPMDACHLLLGRLWQYVH